MDRKEFYTNIYQFYFEDKEISDIGKFFNSSIYELDFLCKQISEDKNVDMLEAKKYLKVSPDIINIDNKKFKEKANFLSSILEINKNDAINLLYDKLNLINVDNNVLEKFMTTIHKELDFTNNDCYQLILNNNINNFDKKYLITKLKLINNELNTLPKYDIQSLIKYTNILNLSNEDIINNTNFAKKIGTFNKIYDNFTIFNNTFAENQNKYNLLFMSNIQNLIIYCSNINYVELNKRYNYIKNTRPDVSIEVILLPKPDFEEIFNLYNRQENIFENYALFFDKLQKNNIKNAVFTNKLIISNKNLVFVPIKFAIGKRFKFTKQDKVNTLLKCSEKTAITPFSKSIQIQSKINSKLIETPTTLQEKVRNQIINKKTKGNPFVKYN